MMKLAIIFIGIAYAATPATFATISTSSNTAATTGTSTTATIASSTSTSTESSGTGSNTIGTPIAGSDPISSDCANVFAAWEKFGKTTTLNKTDPQGCCTDFISNMNDNIFIANHNRSKSLEIGRISCFGSTVVGM